MNMVFTKKMSVSNTRSKKSISQVQSAQEAGLAQVQSADTAVELTMPDFDQKRGATMFAFDLKKKDSRRIYVIAGLLLLHISCASAASDQMRYGQSGQRMLIPPRAKRVEESIDVDTQCADLRPVRAPINIGQCNKMGGYWQTRKNRFFKFRWVTEAEMGQRSDVKSLGGCPEIQYYKPDMMGDKNAKPMKDEQGLKIYAGLYYKCVKGDTNFWGRGVFGLRMWSGTLAHPTWLASPGKDGHHEIYRDLDNIEKIAQRIDGNPAYWIQRLEFDTDGERASFIENIKNGLALCVDDGFGGSNGGYDGCHVTEIHDKSEWLEAIAKRSRFTGQIQGFRQMGLIGR